MYFKDVELYDIDKINNFKSMLAHINEEKQESLETHLKLVYKYFTRLVLKNQLSDIFVNFEKIFFKSNDRDCINLWKEMICNTIYMHDVGKANPDFQSIKMKNIKFKQTPTPDSKHSGISALIYFNEFSDKIKKLNNTKDKSDIYNLMSFSIVNSYIISKHHSILDRFELNKILIKNLKDRENGIEFFKDIFKYFNLDDNKIKAMQGAWDICTIREEQNIELYIYVKFIYSLLIASDFYATYEFKTESEISDFGRINNIDYIFNKYSNNIKYQNYIKYKAYVENKGINPYTKGCINLLRTELMLESENVLRENYDKKIFYLDAPTGSGKTNTSINLAINLIKDNDNLDKIFYVFPFNNLVEQTKDSLINEFGEYMKDNMGVINSITPIKIKLEEENEDGDIKYLNKTINYDEALLNRQFLHYPVVLTTHVNFFDILFGTSRGENMALCHLANSVIIIDEIQSYKNAIWKEISLFLKKFSSILNFKIIIMSATLPKLGGINDGGEDDIVALIKDTDKYFLDKVFKNRVSLNYELLKIKDDVFEALILKVIEVCEQDNINVILEFISKVKANEFFKILNEVEKLQNKEILLLTGDDSKISRKATINKTKVSKNIILVATQAIEAGVDIDMDVGFKDISLLDSEEQFLGRINRSCLKKSGMVYFFNITQANKIYKEDIRNNEDLTLQNDEMKTILKDKNFSAYYSKVLERLNIFKTKHNKHNYENFIIENVNSLCFEEIKKKMKLIDDEKVKYTIFLNTTIIVDENEIQGSEIWEEYKYILRCKKMDYAERKIKLSILVEKLDYFTYEVKKIDAGYNEYIGGIFYFDEGEKYFTNGKFDSQKIVSDLFM